MFGPNRYICSVFEEMRSCLETLNFSYMKGLIEEAQVMANRMEAKLNDAKDIEHMDKKISRLKKEIKELEAKKSDLGGGEDDS